MLKRVVIGCLLVTLVCPVVLILGLGIRHLLIVNSLHRHHEKWSKLEIQDYRFILDIREHFHGPQTRVAIEVQDGQRTSITDIEAQAELTEEQIVELFLKRKDTINKLFEVIDNNVRANFGVVPLAMWFSVEFDEQYHYPTLVNVDHVFLIDGGVTYEIHNFEPVE